MRPILGMNKKVDIILVIVVFPLCDDVHQPRHHAQHLEGRLVHQVRNHPGDGIRHVEPIETCVHKSTPIVT